MALEEVEKILKKAMTPDEVEVLKKAIINLGLEPVNEPSVGYSSEEEAVTIGFDAFSCLRGRLTYLDMNLYLYRERKAKIACFTKQALLDELEKYISSDPVTFAPALMIFLSRPLIYEKLTDEKYMEEVLRSVINESLSKIEEVISQGAPPAEEIRAIQRGVVYHFKYQFPVIYNIDCYLRWFLKHINSLYDPLCSPGLLLLLLLL